MSELEFYSVFVSSNRSLEIKRFNRTNKIDDFIRGKIKVKSILNSDFESNSIYEVLMLFNLLWINLFLLTYNLLILVIVS